MFIKDFKTINKLFKPLLLGFFGVIGVAVLLNNLFEIIGLFILFIIYIVFPIVVCIGVALIIYDIVTYLKSS